MNALLIAMVCHEANRAICEANGDTTQKPWIEAEAWQRDSAVKGVQFAMERPTASPEAQHEAWQMEKRAQGWRYGPVKDAEQKTHPCMVSYAMLPVEQRVKDHVFKAIVQALRLI